ncbi:hypothetical protein SKAU_G00012900 [Synaphobranchus kaupii]|uniref:Uncharacterized protein n=1 Tax=Synaphobranchus kaupii TaxID=118154 RepID=A0A9Q1GAL8_SYNKA|nr:hypothetical protein SKAU_G00012900 [Synaphobranchus kaupii]
MDSIWVSALQKRLTSSQISGAGAFFTPALRVTRRAPRPGTGDKLSLGRRVCHFALDTETMSDPGPPATPGFPRSDTSTVSKCSPSAGVGFTRHARHALIAY